MKKKDDIIGTWLLLEFLYTEKRKNRHYWRVECLNCKDIRKLEESNMKPPAGGKCQHCWGYPKGYSGFRELYDSYTRNAKKLKRDFTLSKDQFKDITSKNCHYCNQKPCKIKATKAQSKWGDYPYNGIDRMDNDKGYCFENCLPCCTICNRAKNNMTYVDFMTYINRIKLLGA